MKRQTQYLLVGTLVVLLVVMWWLGYFTKPSVKTVMRVLSAETSKDYTPHINNALTSLKSSTGIDFEKYRADLVKYVKSQGTNLDDQSDADVINRLYGFLMGISGVSIKKGAQTKIDGSTKNVDDTVKDVVTNALKKILKSKPAELDSTSVKDLRKNTIEFYTYTGLDFKSKDDLSDVVYGFLKGSLVRLKVVDNE